MFCDRSADWCVRRLVLEETLKHEFRHNHRLPFARGGQINAVVEILVTGNHNTINTTTSKQLGAHSAEGISEERFLVSSSNTREHKRSTVSSQDLRKQHEDLFNIFGDDTGGRLISWT